VKSRLKAEANGELHRPRTTRLEYRSQAASGTAGAEHQVQHRRRLAEQGAREETDRVGEIRMVQNVECFGPQLQGSLLALEKLAPYREVKLPHAEPFQRVAPEVSLH